MLMDLAATPWALWVLGTTIVLGVAIAWGVYRTTKVTPREEARTEAAVHAAHKAERIEEARTAHPVDRL